MRSARAAYATLLAQPRVPSQAIAGMIAQLTQGAGGIGLILVIRQRAGSLALAGIVLGALSIAAGLARPLQGALIDRRGPTGVMTTCAIVHPGALIAIVALTGSHAPRWTLVAAGVIAGLALPPVSPVMRVVWARVASGATRTTAYSLVYLTQELAILAGPLILSALIAAWSAATGLVVVALLSGAGALWFTVSLHSVEVGPARTESRPSGTVLRIGAIRLLLVVAFLVGGVIGGVEVAVPTLATAHRVPAAAGLLIALLSVGGVAGAVFYGGVPWRRAPRLRLVLLLGWLSATLALMIPASSLVVVGALLVLAGLSLNPSLTTLSVVVDTSLSGGGAAEAFGWLSTAIAAGTGAGSVLGAALAQRHYDAGAAFAVATVSGIAGCAIAWRARTG